MTGHTRRDFLRTAGCGSAAMALGGARRLFAADTRRPNVIFLFTDDQCENTVAALGNPHIKTPNLDALVKDGLAFTNAYCLGGNSAAVCTPSRKMMLRGRSWFAFDSVAPNWPTAMNEAGYVTFHLGKKGNTDSQVQALFRHNNYLSDKGDRTSGYPCKELVDQSVAFLKEHKQAGGGKPFFMYLAPGNPHDPRIAAPKYMEMYRRDQIPLPPNFLPFHPFDNGEMFIRDEKLAPWPRTEDEIRRHLHEYYAVVTAMDEQIGRLIQALKDLGEFDNTIFVFSSDQGIAIGSHGLMGKQNLYEPSMGVPMFFRGPGIPKGKTSDAFMYILDVFPTVCELVGAPVPAGLQGKSLAPVIRGQADGVRDAIFLAYKNLQRAVRKGPWKLLRYPQIDKTQLFNLQDDPHETRDLAADPQCADKVKELLALLAEQQKLYGDTQPLTADNPRPGDVDLDFFKKGPGGSTPKPAKPGKKDKKGK